MLYRQPRPYATRMFKAGLVRLVGFVAERHRIAKDRIYLDSLDEEALRDVGIRRTATRDGNIYG